MLTQLTLNLPFGLVVFCFDLLVVLFQGLISELARYHLRWYAGIQGSSPWRCTTYSSIAQSVERMTVNHDVTGSSPVRGAK